MISIIVGTITIVATSGHYDCCCFAAVVVILHRKRTHYLLIWLRFNIMTLRILKMLGRFTLSKKMLLAVQTCDCLAILPPLPPTTKKILETRHVEYLDSESV